MFGAELTEFVAFLKQLGIALAGAAGLWGAVFAYRSEEENDESAGVIDGVIARRILPLLYSGVLVSAVAWVWQLFLYDLPLYAHEGIVLNETPGQLIAALDWLTPVFYLWVLFSLGGLLLWAADKERWTEYLKEFYIGQLIFASILISFPAITGEWGAAQFFFFGHSFHSILTVGTVIVLDYLFLLSKPADILKQHIYPILPTLSKVIWVGLGVEFVSTYVVFNDAAAITDKFLFMQTVVAILVINGVLLAGPVLRRLLASIKEEGQKMTRKWMGVADIAGAISISSWMSITFVDFFDSLTLNFTDFFGIYLMIVGVLILGHWCAEQFFDSGEDSEFVKQLTS